MAEGILLFGDSVFFGVGASSRWLGCGKILKKYIKEPVYIKARNFFTTEDALKILLEEKLAEKNFKKIVILFGNNDCRLDSTIKPLVSLEEYRHNLLKMVRMFKSFKKRVYVCNLQPISSEGFYKIFPNREKLGDINMSPLAWQKQYSDICHEVASQKRVKLIDIRTPLGRIFNHIISQDGLHPNDEGHRVIAGILKTELIESI